MFVFWASFLYLHTQTEFLQQPQTHAYRILKGLISRLRLNNSATMCAVVWYLLYKTHKSIIRRSSETLWGEHCFVLWTLSENCPITRTFIISLFILPPPPTHLPGSFIKEHVFQGSSSSGCSLQREQIFFTELLTWKIWPCETTRLPRCCTNVLWKALRGYPLPYWCPQEVQALCEFSDHLTFHCCDLSQIVKLLSISLPLPRLVETPVKRNVLCLQRAY